MGAVEVDLIDQRQGAGKTCRSRTWRRAGCLGPPNLVDLVGAASLKNWRWFSSRSSISAVVVHADAQAGAVSGRRAAQVVEERGRARDYLGGQGEGFGDEPEDGFAAVPGIVLPGAKRGQRSSERAPWCRPQASRRRPSPR